MAKNDDYYRSLDVSPTASHEEIRSAYRKMAFKYHPDRNKDPWAETIFKQINEAYEVLGNASKRADYDSRRKTESQRAQEGQRPQQGGYYGQSSRAGGWGYESRAPRGSGFVYCESCGIRNFAGTRFCVSCGNDLYAKAGTTHGERADSRVERIPNYLPQAILATVCCCPPLGILSVVFAAQVNGKLVVGDIKGAKKAAQYAKNWAWAALGIGLGFWIYALIDLLS